jgi:4-hydroxy-tetrahydrodipicolinate reductase
MKNAVRVLLIGSAGRMGQAIVEAAKGDSGIDIIGLVDQGDPLEPAMLHCHVAIDFSHADAITEICRAAIEQKKALVIGTTGHTSKQAAVIEECAKTIPIVKATNFSVGVNALFWLTEKAAKLLGPEFDLEIVEMHHRLKKDAPSGTAVTLLDILKRQRKIEKATHGRQGNVGERSSGEIGLHAIRGGDVVGDHTVIFAGAGERLELTHRAASRTTFAKGALRAASWIKEQPPGLYSMQDVLDLPQAE